MCADKRGSTCLQWALPDDLACEVVPKPGRSCAELDQTGNVESVDAQLRQQLVPKADEDPPVRLHRSQGCTAPASAKDSVYHVRTSTFPMQIAE